MKIALNCVCCGRSFSVYPVEVRRGRKYCSSSCRSRYSQRVCGFNNQGGIVDNGDGYYKIWDNGKYTLYHRWLVEQNLGCKLDASEYVHHKNGDKSDNRLENLQIVSPSDHSKHHGERVFINFSGNIISFVDACRRLNKSPTLVRKYMNRNNLSHQQAVDRYSGLTKNYHTFVKIGDSQLSFTAACRKIGRHISSVLGFKKRHNLSHQEAIDYYCIKCKVFNGD